MKNIAVKSIVVLSVICLCTSLLLAVTNLVTSPIIEKADQKATVSSLKEIMPNCETFDEVTLPKTIEYVDKVWTCNDGIVVKLSASGYAPGIIIMVGITNNGEITKVKTMSCNETAGYGKACEEAWYQDQYSGMDRNLTGLDAISGATKTSTGYRAAISAAFDVLDLLKNEEA